MYKGNTDRRVVSLFFDDDIAEKNKFYIDKKYTETDLWMFLKLDDNCDRKWDDGEYKLVLKGFDKEDEEKIEIESIDDEKCGTCASKGGAILYNVDW